MEVRLAQPADAVALMRLNAAFNGEGLGDEAHIAASLQYNPTERAWLLWADGRPVGFLCTQITRSICYPFPSAEITELYVEESARRMGGGMELIRCALAELSSLGARSVRVLTGLGNVPARALYEKSGFALSAEALYEITPNGRE